MSGIKQNRIVFPPFRLDYADQRLFRDDSVVPLRPKAFEVLQYLSERPGVLVTKDEILEAVWPATSVTDTVLKVCIREIREALGDDPGSPRFIETSHRRGYRFIAAIEQSHTAVEPDRGAHLARLPVRPGGTHANDVVGRDDEIEALEQSFQGSLEGRRQVVFVTGEPGIGKSTLVEEFLRRASSDHDILIARGQCLEQYGGNEAFLPLLEAVSRLCREPGSERTKEVFYLTAPTLLAQIPWLLRGKEVDGQRLETFAGTREHLLREVAEAVEALSAHKPLVMLIEDLHWSDYSTLDLVSYLARRNESARLMFIGTYRPEAVITSRHPLSDVKRELLAHRLCQELPLRFLNEPAVTQYLAARFQHNSFPQLFADLIHHRTDGNPLFMINLLDFFLSKGLIVKRDDEWKLPEPLDQLKTGMPDNVRQMIEKQIDNLSKDHQDLLEAASVAGIEFSSAAVAAALGDSILNGEERCENLVRRHLFLQAAWSPDPAHEEISARYSFIHALYQNVLYDRIPPAKRAHLHGTIGRHIETALGARANDMAAELSMHFEKAGDSNRAVFYLQRAAENAKRRFAYQETVELANKGLRLLEKIPLDESAQLEHRLLLQTSLAAGLSATQGYGSTEVEVAYSRARELCQQSGNDLQLFPVLWGIWRFYLIRSNLTVAHELAQRLLELARDSRDSAHLVEAHLSAGVTFNNIGDFESASAQLEQGASLYDPNKVDTHLFLYGHDPRVVARCFNAWALWSLGLTELALETIREAYELAEQLQHPETRCFALFFSAWTHQLRRESENTLKYAEATIELADKYGFAQWSAFGSSLRGWALADQGQHAEGIIQMRQTLDLYRAIGSEISRPHFLALLAEALRASGEPEEALRIVEEGLSLADETGQRYYEAELHHLKGLLMLDLSKEAEARACFLNAVELARSQKARSFELRAATSLASISG